MADALSSLEKRLLTLETKVNEELSRSLSDRAELFQFRDESQRDREVLHRALESIESLSETAGEVTFHKLFRSVSAPVWAVVIGLMASGFTVEVTEYFTVAEHSRALAEYELIKKQRDVQLSTINTTMVRIEERLIAMAEIWNSRNPNNRIFPPSDHP